MPPHDLRRKIAFIEEQRELFFMSAAMSQLNKDVNEFTDEDLNRFRLDLKTGNNYNGTYYLFCDEVLLASFSFHFSVKRQTFEWNRKLYQQAPSASQGMH